MAESRMQTPASPPKPATGLVFINMEMMVSEKRGSMANRLNFRAILMSNRRVLVRRPVRYAVTAEIYADTKNITGMAKSIIRYSPFTRPMIITRRMPRTVFII